MTQICDITTHCSSIMKTKRRSAPPGTAMKSAPKTVLETSLQRPEPHSVGRFMSVSVRRGRRSLCYVLLCRHGLYNNIFCGGWRRRLEKNPPRGRSRSAKRRETKTTRRTVDRRQQERTTPPAATMMGLQKHPHQYEMINMDEEEGEPLAPSSSAADANGDGRSRRHRLLRRVRRRRDCAPSLHDEARRGFPLPRRPRGGVPSRSSRGARTERDDGGGGGLRISSSSCTRVGTLPMIW